MPDRPIFISDFDGTLTDNQAVAEQYFQAYTAAMAADLNIPVSDARARMTAAQQQVMNKPAQYGWQIDGQTVASVGDHMILARVAAEIVLDAVGPLEGNFEHMRRYFEIASEGSGSVFRPGTGEYIRTLSRLGRLVIVSNSGTEIVSHKLDRAFPDIEIEIIGGAKKYQLEPLPVSIKMPASMQPEAFPRPVLLQRGFYYQALEKAADPQPLQSIAAVIGDVFELDLALPAALGLPIAMLTTPYTPPWEIPYVKKHGFVGQNLYQVTEWLVQRLKGN